MNIQLIRDLHNEKPEKIYYKKRKKKCNKIDLAIYQILNYVYKNNQYSIYYKKTDFLIELIASWENTLISFYRDAESTSSIYKTFKEGFDKFTDGFSDKETKQVLYYFPWHLRLLQYTSPNARQLNTNFIENIASMSELTEVKGSPDSWHGVGTIDEISILTIFDDMEEENMDMLSYQFTENLPMLMKAMDDLDKVRQGHFVKINDDDKHAYNVIGFLVHYYVKHQDELKLDNLYHFLTLVVYHMCYWHVEMKEVESKWSFKPPFIHKVMRKLSTASQ